MNNRAHIENELKSIAPSLLNIPVAMPYNLPDSYFSGLASEVLTSIKKDKELPALLTGFSKAMPYTIPVDYFEQFPGSVLQRIYTESLPDQEPALFSNISRATPYTLPIDYFENFPKTVLQKIKEEEQQQAIPAGYFENLPDLMLATVRKLDATKELNEVAPLLNTISKQPVQHVPAGYFENLQPDMVKAISENITPVVSITKRTNWLKYAVAASIVLMLSFGAYFLFNQNKPSVPSIANQPTENVINDQLAKLDAATIEDYLKTNNAVVQTALPVGGVEELSNGDLDELLQGFTEQQLKKHIEETPELPTVTSLKNHI